MYHPHSWQTELGWESLQHGCEGVHVYNNEETLIYSLISDYGRLVSQLFVFNCRTEHPLVIIMVVLGEVILQEGALFVQMLVLSTGKTTHKLRHYQCF